MSAIRLFTDQLGRSVQVNEKINRIVSLVPSVSELLFDLGLEKKIVGVTKFCCHPKGGFNNAIRIGGTKNYNVKKIAQLAPDLIIANIEENVKETIVELSENFPVWVSDIKTIHHAFDLINKIGVLTNRSDQAENINTKVRSSLAGIENKFSGTALYLIWKEPMMVAGKDTFINSIMHFVGLRNLIHDNRYPILSVSALIKMSPDYILLSSEPFPFSEKHIEYFQSIVPSACIKLVDGEMFSWYGSRMIHFHDYFENLHLIRS